MNAVTSLAATQPYVQALFSQVRALSTDGLGVTRAAYSPTETAVIDFLVQEGLRLGLAHEVDLAGNHWLTRLGQDPSLPAIVLGSHVDSVSRGGNYDGLAGIVAGFAIVKGLVDEQRTLQRSVRILILRGEESSFFGKAYMGSLAMLGKLRPADLALSDQISKKTLEQAMRDCGINTRLVTQGKPLVDLSKIGVFLELHIEQSHSLDKSPTTRVASVQGIRGNIRHKLVICHGETGHSGAVPKQDRHDAVLAFCELGQAVDRLWDEYLQAQEDLVFTMGVVNTCPTAAISVIPGLLMFTIDIRSISMETCAKFHRQMCLIAREISERRGVRFEFDEPLITQSAMLDSDVCKQLCHCANQVGVPIRVMASGAGHDSAVLANAGVSVGMIFVANQNGSHNPHEAMQMADFMQGVEVLNAFVRQYH